MEQILLHIQNQDVLDLQEKLLSQKSFKKRFEIIKSFPKVKNFFQNSTFLKNVVTTLSEKKQYVLYCLIAIDQAEHIFSSEVIREENLHLLIKYLLEIENFYKNLGGLIGYHLTCLHLLAQKEIQRKKGIYHPPIAQNIASLDEQVQELVIEGICNLPYLAEIYPVGGAADRLSLRDEITGAFQIAATLEFAKKSLLEWLIEDLQAKEFLYWKLFQKTIQIPIVLMSSEEKNGTEHLKRMLSEKNWFGKKKEDFFLFSQPLVPTMNKEGQWCLKGPYQLLLKPGGHGVIWKLAKESGALRWFKEKGKTKALVRQINNVIAGVDYGLLAFLGAGFAEDKDFGFASCPRIEGVSEGVNVIIETNKGFSLTNIEYCDHKHFQVEEKDLLANTNLLFVDLAMIEELLAICPIPGLLVNAKKMKYKNHLGDIEEQEILRLESMMQNIADVLIEKEKMKRTFITCNKRAKTISTIKKEFAFGSSMLQTPEQCFLDLLENARDLLVNYCKFDVPLMRDPLSFFAKGPSFIFLYHPAFGPQYEIIQQKLKGGKLALESEMHLQIADFFAENLSVDGSLYIITEAIMGHKDEKGQIQFSENTGKCVLKNVKVQNLGIYREASRSFWKDEIVHREKCEIFIEKGGEFFAENISLQGNLRIRVPAGMKATAFMKNGKLEIHQEILEGPSWNWRYFIKKNKIVLEPITYPVTATISTQKNSFAHTGLNQKP